MGIIDLIHETVLYRMSGKPESASSLLASAIGLPSSDQPFPWQQDLLARFLANDIPAALDIPTGLGKTAVMAIWLAARIRGADIPRRLVYVVDRRAVVDQATTVAMSLQRFVEAHSEIRAKLGAPDGLPISTLRGQFVDNRKWLNDPASPAVIVGTVDMIGSRLLFEGYGVSRKMRPYHAGLLGADTLLVLDEAHLVPPFEKLLEQIADIESNLRPVDVGPRKLVPELKLLSLSATGRSDRPAFGLSEADLKPGTITRKRLNAAKHLKFDTLQKDEDLADAMTRNVWQLSENGTKPVKIIVFADKREVAIEVKRLIDKKAKGDKAQVLAPVQLDSQLLVGGRRVHEREATAQWLETHSFVAGAKARPQRATFVFATSAGEVGIDLDADHLVGDLVTWERMVQRLGRVNRRGDGDATIVVVKEPDPKPTKAEENALKKPQAEREKKDLKIIAAYEAKLEKPRSLSKPFELLRKEERGIDVSPAALRDLKLSTQPNPADIEDDKLRAARRADLQRATSEVPLRPALSRPLLDAWAMTSLPQHTGRPKIQPWLRGWIKDDPQTTVVWRRHLPLERGEQETPRKVIRDFFDAAPPHTSEMLETEMRQVVGWLKKRAEAIKKNQSIPQEPAAHLQTALPLDQPFALILDSDRELVGSPMSVSELLATLDDKKPRETLEGHLADSTLVVDARFAGLSDDGLLDESEAQAPQTLDGDGEWLPPINGEPAIRFRIRDSEELLPTSDARSGWRHRLRVPVKRSEEGEAQRWLIVEKWRNDSVTADDGSSSLLQTLVKHQDAAVLKVKAISERLSLPEPYAKMLEIAARLHDEGKRAENWQKAFHAPAVGGPFAKTPGPINQILLNGYRHEFGSLPALTRDDEFKALPNEELRDLALHLVAAHHGFARPLIGTEGCVEPPSLLEGRARETALRFVRLQRRWGPWGLAWWESLLRAADQQASREVELAPESTSTH